MEILQTDEGPTSSHVNLRVARWHLTVGLCVWKCKCVWMSDVYIYVDDKYAWVECAVQHCIRSIMVQNTRKSEQIHTALERQSEEGAFWRL